MQMQRLQLKLSHLARSGRAGRAGHSLEVCALTQSPPSALSQPAPLPCAYFCCVSRLLPSFFWSHFPLHVSLKMSSGVQVADEVKDILQTMKVIGSTCDAMDRIRIVEFKIVDDQIKPIKITKERDLVDKGYVFDYFRSLMQEKECKYIYYDCHFEIKSTKKEEIVFVMWAHENAPVKQKMILASSKQALKKIFEPKHHLELHDFEELNARAFASQLGKDVISLEGKPV